METDSKPGCRLLREGLFQPPETPGAPARLIGSRCLKCGDIAFPQKPRCARCDGTKTEGRLLSPRGRIYSYTILRQALPGYRLPNIIAMVKLPEDDHLMILTQIRDCTEDEVNVGLEVESIVEELFTTPLGEGVIGYAFRPVRGAA
ncbi:MAG: OB-fold domain-containing protein [Proteobacteria bacterium]|nr:OB-fold domain-containing protein [Pseudomonadota bacterium]